MTRHLGSTCACVQEAKPRPLTPDVFQVIPHGAGEYFWNQQLFHVLVGLNQLTGWHLSKPMLTADDFATEEKLTKPTCGESQTRWKENDNELYFCPRVLTSSP